MADDETIIVSGSKHRRRSRNIWTHEQRVCLHILSHEFHQTAVLRAKVFNKIFEAELAACGTPCPGLSPGSIYQEYWKSKTPGTSTRNPWKDVFFPPDTVNEHTMRGSIRARISLALSFYGMNGALNEPAQTEYLDTLTLRSTSSEQNLTRYQVTGKRKRCAAILMTPPSTNDGEEDELDPRFSSRKARRQNYSRHGSPVVLIPAFAEAPASRDLLNPDGSRAPIADSTKPPIAIRKPIQPVTPRSYLSTHSVNAGLQFISEARSEMLFRRNMEPIPVTPEKFRIARSPLRNLLEQEMHPRLPRLLFRTFTTKSQGLNSQKGFVCGRFANARMIPSKPPVLPDWNDILEHLDPSKTPLKCSKCSKDKCCNKTLVQKIPSPYISVSSDLIWVIRKMIAQGENSNVSVIDTSALDPQSVYYVPPFQQELARKHVFHGREHRYKGYSEHLVWNEIPGSAIIKTFSYQELVDFAERDGLTRATVRLAELRCSGTSSTEILKIMKQRKYKITPEIAVFIANFVIFLGVDSSTPLEGIALPVCEIIRGWALRNAETTTAERRETADRFMDTFYRNSDRVLSLEEQVKLKYA